MDDVDIPDWMYEGGTLMTPPHAPVTTGQQEPAEAVASVPAGVRPPGSRPSPRPRTVPPVAPAPVPDDMTLGNCQVSTRESEDAPGGEPAQDIGLEVSTLQSSLHFTPDTVRDWLRKTSGNVKEYVTPPSVLTEPPASVAELAAYAHWGAWTAGTDGPLRRLGIVWHRLVSLPVTVVCRYTEWIFQRVGRAVPVYLLWKLLISTGPGPWFADHIIRPALGFVAWVLL